jgi:hypothetical protein
MYAKAIQCDPVGSTDHPAQVPGGKLHLPVAGAIQTPAIVDSLRAFEGTLDLTCRYYA